MSWLNVFARACKVKAIDEFPYPKNIEQVRRFLGMLNEYRGFIKNYGAVAEPLNNLCTHCSMKACRTVSA